MMDPISWSDLGYQKMTNNSYKSEKQQSNFASMVAGATVYMTESSQQTRRLEKEDTQEKKDAVFDAAFRCAMNEA